MKNVFEDFQAISKENTEAAASSFGVLNKGMQQVATESADYAKKSFEEGTAVFEQLMGVKSVDKAFEIQTNFAKSAYEGYVAQATKMSEIVTDMAKEAYKPYEAAFAKAAK